MGTSQTLEYFLPHTVVRFSGKRSETADEFTPKPQVDFEAAVECVERADTQWPLRIALNESFFRDVEGSIGFTSDRRLTSLSASSTGTASKLATGAVRFLTSTLAVAAQLATGAGPMRNLSKPVKKPEDVYATECAEAVKNRQDLREAVVAVRAAIIETAKALGVDSTKRLRDLTHTMQVLTELQAEADAHFAAWRASKKKTTTRALELEVPILELPKAGELDTRLDNLDETLLGPCWKPFRELGVFAAVDRGPHVPDDGPAPGETAVGFYYRSPRVVWLSIYQQTGENGARLVERRRQAVYDAACTAEFVSCESGTWSKRVVSAELDGGSALSKISTSSQGGATAVGEALSGAVEQAVKGLADAESIAKSLDTMRDRGIDRRLVQLNKQKKLIEAEIARDAAAADVTKLRELAQINHEVDLLNARNSLAELKNPKQTTSANGSDAPSAKRIVISLES